MKLRWTGKNIELESLAKNINDFFVGRSFSKRMDSIERIDLRVLVYSLKREEHSVIVRIELHSSPKDFEVEFTTDRKAETMARLGVLSTLLGSGFYLRGRLDNFAYVEKLEGDFWDYINEEIKKESDDAKA